MDYIIDNIENYKDKNGWISGQFFNFEKLNYSKDVEVKFQKLNPGDTFEEHFHPYGREVIIVVKGKLVWKLNGENKNLSKGDFIIMKNNVREALVEVVEPSETICIRTPSIPDNKVALNK